MTEAGEMFTDPSFYLITLLLGVIGFAITAAVIRAAYLFVRRLSSVEQRLKRTEEKLSSVEGDPGASG
jgi:uncharacterized membrane protein YciS (DUF1049 family)